MLEGQRFLHRGGHELEPQLLRLYGRRSVGKPVTLLIPPERRDEEPDILARIRRGERIEHYETVRQPAEGRSSKIYLPSEPKILTDLPLVSPEISTQVCTTRTTS